MAGVECKQELSEKRQEFKKYLEKTGVTDKLTTALMKLYQEDPKPDEPIEFLRKRMCEECPDAEFIKELQGKVKKLNKEKRLALEELEIVKTLVKKSAAEIDALLVAGFEALIADETGQSLLKEYLTYDLLQQLKPLRTSFKASLLDNVQCGFTHYDVDIGVNASDQNAYDVFDPLFKGILEDFHDIEVEDPAPPVSHPQDSDWGDPQDLENLDTDTNFIKSIRIVIGRNLDQVEFMPILTVAKLQEIEEKIKAVLDKIEDEDFKGTYYSFKDIDDDEARVWIDEGLLFPDPDDKFMKAAQSYRCWSRGRGFYFNESKSFRVWVNYEEHLHLITFEESADFPKVYERMTKAVDFFKELTFAKHQRWGFLTHNLKNIGNAMRIIVKAKLPKLSLEENAEKWSTLVEGNNLISKDLGHGYFELSSGKKVGITEIELAKSFQKIIADIITAEKCLY